MGQFFKSDTLCWLVTVCDAFEGGVIHVSIAKSKETADRLKELFETEYNHNFYEITVTEEPLLD